MNNRIQSIAVNQAGPSTSNLSALQREVAIMAGRLADLLRQRFKDETSVVSASLAFLDYQYRDHCADTAQSFWTGKCIERLTEDKHSPCCQLINGLKLLSLEVELFILAGMADEHEGYADIFRTLHPSGQPLVTLGLAAQLLCNPSTGRGQLRLAVESSYSATLGLFIREQEQPFYTCSLRLPNLIWSVLQGVNAWPDNISLRPATPVLAGLSCWLEQHDTLQAHKQLDENHACSILLLAENVDIAAQRAVALCESSGLPCVLVDRANQLDHQAFKLMLLHCLVRGVTPVLKINREENSSNSIESLNLVSYPYAIVICAEQGSGVVASSRPTLSLQVDTLDSDSLREMWGQLLPELSEHSAQLAARFPFEPAAAKNVCDDLHYLYTGKTEQIDLNAVADAVRTRSSRVLNSGVQLIRPVASWQQLVLQDPQLSQLKDASQRLFFQSCVLDDWQFLKGRRGARGVRMLFVGPPGTGKTLSAEVLANALNVDLLQVDLSRVVSKWIGETEKNLAEVFLTAESAKAVLFFDEADALFGKRTEVTDAHDRYANLETAYLLSRLERYDGLAILATNYRQNIDTAFTRRLEYIIEFEEPGFNERLKLWECHLPDQAPLDKDVNLTELASLFAIVGGHIRNAAVSAAYMAAQQECTIRQQHFIDAIRREYEKSGKAFREISTR